MNLKQFIVFVSIAFLAIASSLAAAKVVPIFANKLVPVPIPEPVDEAEFGGWKYLSFMVSIA